MEHDRVLRLRSADKARLRIMFLAKHALSGGHHDRIDGNHAVYHHELLTTLSSIGLNVEPADHYEALYTRPNVDFVIPLLNRGGFQNSEMLAPLLLTRHGLPFLGASPIIRGLTDDKHLMKITAQHVNVPTIRWVTYRRGGLIAAPKFDFDRLVVKPNASSASWGVRVVDNWNDGFEHVRYLHAQGHDAIVEPWWPLLDVAVPVVGADGPWILPPLAYRPDDPEHLRSYEEKRALVPTGDDPLAPIDDESVRERLVTYTQRLLPELWPFDYGRFEYRYDPHTDDVRFMEVNLSCNLWSKKTISRSAATIGVDHASLVESIVTHSLERQGIIATPAERRLAA